MRLFVNLIIPRHEPFVKPCKHKFDKTRQICYNTNQGVLHKTVGGSNLPPEMEVSNMDMMEVFYLLNLIINIIKLVLDICDRKRK